MYSYTYIATQCIQNCFNLKCYDSGPDPFHKCFDRSGPSGHIFYNKELFMVSVNKPVLITGMTSPNWFS